MEGSPLKFGIPGGGGGGAGGPDFPSCGGGGGAGGAGGMAGGGGGGGPVETTGGAGLGDCDGGFDITMMDEVFFAFSGTCAGLLLICNGP